jgi:hypothetical protein
MEESTAEDTQINNLDRVSADRTSHRADPLMSEAARDRDDCAQCGGLSQDAVTLG